MRFSVLLVAAGLAATALPVAAMAEDRAVLIIEARYRNGAGTTASPEAEALFDAFRREGWATASGMDLARPDMSRALELLERRDADRGRRVAVLTGRFLRGRHDSYLMDVNAGNPGLSRAADQGLPLSLVIDLLEDGGDGSVLLLGDSSGGLRSGLRLSDGIGPLGVTDTKVVVITGSPHGVSRAAQVLSRDDGTVARALRADASLKQVAGPRAGDPVVAPRPAPATAAPPAPSVDAPRSSAPAAAEAEAYRAAMLMNSVAGWDRFLAAHPGGQYAEAARTRRATALAAEGQRAGSTSAALGEIQLNLSLGERTQVQRMLTLLTYDTNGVDGTFGSGTRAAITRWQRDNGFAATGFLTAASIERLRAMAGERSRSLETQARQAQTADRARDQAFWEDVAEQGGLPGMRSYLEAWPDGIHADQARQALAGASAQTEEGAYQRALAGGTVEGWQAFLQRYPATARAQEASRRVRDLETAGRDAQAERGLNLDPVLARLIEARLAGAGLDTGAVDGRFDADTRRALRQYQRNRNLRVSGYVNDSTLVRLLVDSVAGD